jgi:hypothetical protein
MSRVPSEREIVIVNNKTESWYIPTGTSIPPLVYICTHNKKRNGIFNVSLSKTDFEDFCIWIQDNIPPLNESLLSLIPLDEPKKPVSVAESEDEKYRRYATNLLTVFLIYLAIVEWYNTNVKSS